MSIIKHNNIEKSFYKYVDENLAIPYGYAISYGEVSFDTIAYDLWLTLTMENIGAGAKKFSSVRVDVVWRTVNESFNTDETTAIDRIRDVFTNTNIQLLGSTFRRAYEYLRAFETCL